MRMIMSMTFYAKKILTMLLTVLLASLSAKGVD